MKREELGTVLLVVVVFAVTLVATVHWAGWFADSSLSNGASNLLGILSGPALLAGIALGAHMRWSRSCKVPWCLRYGEHPVAGTCAKVCTRHHTRRHHAEVHDCETAENPGRLGWGESHDG